MFTLYLVDALNLLFRSYYAIGGMASPTGESTGALYGFIKSINLLKKKYKPTFLTVIFDGERNNQARKAIYPPYKGQRKTMPNEFSKQVQEAISFCKMSAIPHLAIPEVEADDTIGSVATWAVSQEMRVLLISNDKDLCQLVTDRIKILSPKGNEIGIAEVYKQHGVYPHQIVDFLSLVGDKSDNVPGLLGFGPKTTAKLLENYTLDELLLHPEKIEEKTKQQTFRAGKEQIALNRRLFAIDKNVHIPQTTSFYRLKKSNDNALRNFYEQKHFLTLLKELEVTPLARSTRQSLRLVSSLDKLQKLLSEIDGEYALALYPERWSEKPTKQKLAGVAITDNPYQGWYIPLNASLNRVDATIILREFFCRQDISALGHDLQRQLHLFDNLSSPKLTFDTLLAAKLLEPHRLHTLQSLAFEHLHINTVALSRKENIIDIPTEQTALLGVAEVEQIYQLAIGLRPMLADLGLLDLLIELELPAMKAIHEMEKREVKIDKNLLQKKKKILEQQIDRLIAQIKQHIGPSAALASLEQCARLCWEEGSKKQKISIEDLETLQKGNPLTGTILYTMRLQRVLENATKLEELSHLLWQTDNFGKLYCPDLDLHLLSQRNSISETIAPRKGALAIADYSQLEMRLLAHFSEDPRLIHAFDLDEDIHSNLAAELNQLAPNQVTEEMRKQSKAIHFAILRRQNARELGKKLCISTSAATALLDAFYHRHPRLEQFLQTHLERIRASEIATTLLGRNRSISEINSHNSTTRKRSEQLAISWLIEGSAAELLKKSLLATKHTLDLEPMSGTCWQLGDGLVIELIETSARALYPHLKKNLERIYPLRVPLVVQIAIGKNWAECHNRLTSI